MAQKARIGILLTSGQAEAKKEDLIDITRRVPARPWLQNAPDKFKVHREKILGELSHRYRRPMDGFAGDISIGEYIKFKYGSDVDIDYIQPKDITEKRLKRNDINFLLIYDLLEAYHIEKKEGTFRRFRDAITRAGNVFPNIEYQKLINSKIMYYNYLHEKGIPIVSTITVTTQQWKDRVAQPGGALAATVEILDEIRRRGFVKYVCKPEYGQEAIAVQFYDVNKTPVEEVRDHFEWNFWRYPGLIIQECVDGFGQNMQSPELRMYFVGQMYQYTTVLLNTGCHTPVQEGGNLQFPEKIDFNACKALAARTVKSLPDITLKREGRNVLLPKLLTRVDVGCIRKGTFDPWVNEVEFVPSLFMEKHNHPMDSRLGDEMVRLTKSYMANAKTKALGKKATGKKSLTTLRQKTADRLVSKGSLCVRRKKHVSSTRLKLIKQELKTRQELVKRKELKDRQRRRAAAAAAVA